MVSSSGCAWTSEHPAARAGGLGHGPSLRSAPTPATPVTRLAGSAPCRSLPPRRARSRSRVATPARPGSPPAHPAASRSPATARGWCSCARTAGRSGPRPCGCSTWRPGSSAWWPTRSTCSRAAREQLTAAERSRRERMREGGAGITAFSLDDAGVLAAFALSSRLFVADLVGDPDGARAADRRAGRRPAPVAGRVAGGVRQRGRPARRRRRRVGRSAARGAGVGHGDVRARRVRCRRGARPAPRLLVVARLGPLLVERADVAPVPVWYVSDPEHPDRAPAEHRYPVAGAANADVTLWLVGLDGGRVEVVWDRAAFEYVAAASWNREGPPLVQVLSPAAGPRAGARRRRGDRCHDGAARAGRRRMGGRRPGHARAGRRATGDGRGGRRPLRAVPRRAGRCRRRDCRCGGSRSTADRVVAHTSGGLGEDGVHAWSARRRLDRALVGAGDARRGRRRRDHPAGDVAGRRTADDRTPWCAPTARPWRSPRTRRTPACGRHRDCP